MKPQDVLMQRRAANALLERGVLVDKVKAPLLYRLLGRRYIKIIFHHNTISELVKYCEVVIDINLPDKELLDINIIDSCHIVSGNAQLAMEAMIVAANIKVPLWSRKKLARYLLTRMEAYRFSKGWRFYNNLNEVKDFIHTIRLIKTANNLSPMSQRSQNQPTK